MVPTIIYTCIIIIIIIIVIIVIIIVVIIKYCYYTCIYIIYVSPCLTVKSPLVGRTKSSPWGPHVWYLSTLSWFEKSPLVISPLFCCYRCLLFSMFNSPILWLNHVKSPFPSGEEKKNRTQMWITCTQSPDQHPRTQNLHHVYTQESQEILSTRLGCGWE